MAKKVKLPTKTIVIKNLELRWPKITTPDIEGKFADNKFKTHGIPQTDDQLEAVKKALNDAAESKEFQAYFSAQGVSDEAVLTLPIKEFKNKDDGEVEEVGFNFKSKYRPPVFDGKKNKLPITAKIGNGTIANIEAVIFPWAKEEKVREKVNGKIVERKEVGFGVSMRLAALQIKQLVEGGGQSNGSAFDADEEGFEYDSANDVNDDGETAGDDYDL